MARLIEIQAGQPLPARLTLQKGDLLLFQASGGHVRSGTGVVERLGPFLPGIMSGQGEVLAPAGAPNAVLFLARLPGKASIDIVRGDPWHSPETQALELTVVA
jgi:hypothetical protein